MLYYLLDASALILRYLKEKSIPDLMHLQKLKGEAFFYFPNFCVVEVFNTFARWYYRDKKISKKEYDKYCEIFRYIFRKLPQPIYRVPDDS